ncbi:hypothetical protein [Arthrobacter sp. CG_A4]|nr:hypothetical protein [Arthrobacter sp. CG_A4]
MSHGFILTEEDSAPEGASFAEDFIELSLLTMGEPKPLADLIWDNQSQAY